MPSSHDTLFARRFRPHGGHPFRPRLSAARRWGMIVVLLLLGGLIGGYWYLTDAARVRAMAEAYLADLLGARVDMRSATLSLFEGLRLDDVTVRVDRAGDAPDAVVFSAQAFIVNYDPATLLSGRLRATRIVAVNPHVRLSENLDDHSWNYQRLFQNRDRRRGRAGATRPTTAPGVTVPDALPEVLLRDAVIDYAEIASGRYRSVGSLAVEGQLTPAADQPAGHYAFDVRSRGQTEATGPVITGTLNLDDGTVTAQLRNFAFGRDVKAMLPSQVRTWCEEHQLDGRLDVRELTYRAGRRPGESSFVVDTRLERVTLALSPREVAAARGPGRARPVWVDGPADNGAPTDPQPAAAGRDGAGGGDRGLFELTVPDLGGPLFERLESLRTSPPLALRDVAGAFVFTESGIDVKGLAGRFDGNDLTVDGRIGGYSPDAPFDLKLASPPGRPLAIPHTPRYVRGLPWQVREAYDKLRPEGACDLWVRLVRESAGGRLEASGQIDIRGGSFAFDMFPYPVTRATGTIAFGKDDLGRSALWVRGIRGRGLAGGPNDAADVRLDGSIAPLDGTCGVDIRVRGENVRSEPALTDAFPRPVREALRVFDHDGRGEYPQFAGRFDCAILRPVGRRSPWTINVDIDLRDAAGRFVSFPYPLENVSGRVEIREGYVDIKHARTSMNGATLDIDGRVRWGHANEPLRTDLTITARSVPVDRKLTDALPPAQRQWLEAAGATGVIDLDGRIFPPAAGDPRGRHAESGYEFDVTLRDGAAMPVADAGGGGTSYTVTGIAGLLKLKPQRLEVVDLHGRRGASEIKSSGVVAWPDDRLSLALTTTASDLALDRPLYAALPVDARAAWDALRPEGSVDAALVLKSGDARVGGSSTSSRSSSSSGDAATAEAPGSGLPVAGAEASHVGEGQARGGSVGEAAASGLNAEGPHPDPPPANPERGPERASVSVPATPPLQYELTLRPRALAVTPEVLPCRLEDVKGTVVATPQRVTLADVTARRANNWGTLSLAGTGTPGPNGLAWDLAVGGRDVSIDKELRRALPPSIADVFAGLDFRGKLSFDFSKLAYRPGPRAAASPGAAVASADAEGAAAAALASTRPAPPTADLDFACRLTIAGEDGAALNIGVPVTDVRGAVDLAGVVRRGRLSTLAGAIDLPRLTLAGRAASDFKADLTKPADVPGLQIGRLRGTLAGGTVGGQVDVVFPDDGPSRYAMNLVLHDADVKELAGPTEQNVSGRLGASLALEGDWVDPKSRRGRGDVQVEGKEMYRIPVVLGLLEIANLSLPINSPFNEASARYGLEGQRVTFESIELRSNNMLMQGGGTLDFGDKTVRLNFTTDNPNWPKVPVIGDLIQGARSELLQIHVRGTLQQPKVSAGTFNTFTTTVDEVLKGDGK